MSDVTRPLKAAAAGDPRAAANPLPLVHDKLRKLAAARLASEPPGHVPDTTALVHVAYLRLVGADPSKPWEGRGHFFAAAAEAMRRVLIEDAGHRLAAHHGGGRTRVPLDRLALAAPSWPIRSTGSTSTPP